MKRMRWVLLLALLCTAVKLRRGVHPDVVKYGFYADGDDGAYQGTAMSFADMIEFAADVKARGDHPPDSAPKDVVLLEVLDQTAAVKVVAWWGIDYLHLAKYEGQWKIVHVLWQTFPPG
ncbi:MAG: nuclear transport factor 2 family protein [Planctomycetota bacterium]